MREEAYIRSLHYCPACGQVIGCGEGGCDSQQFRKHLYNCRMNTKGKAGRLRYNEGENGVKATRSE